MAAQVETHRIPPRNLAVREEVGFDGVREQQRTRPDLLSRGSDAVTPAPTEFPQFGGAMVRAAGREALYSQADAYQKSSTDRSWAPAPVYPGQRRPQELNREVVPKNHQEFELVGRNIGPTATANVMGGYVGRDKVGEDVTEKFTQRTVDDFKEYFHPTAAARFERGSASVYSQFDQNRIEAREINYKNTPGRFSGAFRHDIRLVGAPQDELEQRGRFKTSTAQHANEQMLKETMKRDDQMTYRQREDENPNREGLRMQYADIYSQEWNTLEKLENPRRVQHTVESDIDVTMLRPWATNPYTPPIGIVPFSGQNSTDLNDSSYQMLLKGKTPGQQEIY